MAQVKIATINMQPVGPVADNSESRDCEDKFRDDDDNNSSTCQNLSTTTTTGYYDAERCRAHIANQTRVSKIDRFAAQVARAIEVETDVHSRLSKVFNMYVKHSAQVTHDFVVKCRLGSQRHRQDRILNQSKNATKKHLATTPATISNDLLYGEGVHLVQELLDQSITLVPIKHVKRRKGPYTERDLDPAKCQELFEPSVLVKGLEDSISDNLKKSESLMDKLENLQQSFKNLASEHRSKVDHVYTAEEERQASTVVRRSAYNLSIAAIKAASTPIGPL